MSDQPLDPRVNAFRPDVADRRLASRVRAERFVDGVPRQVATGVVTLRGEPEASAAPTSQLLFGERVLRFDEREGWAWVQNLTDGYVGWLPAAALTDPGPEPTHRISAPASFLMPEPTLKTAPIELLSFGSPVTPAHAEGRWVGLVGGGFVHAAHLAALDAPEPDAVAAALRFVGTPYLWGGRSRLGVDCSGLVQLVLEATGIPCPRDSDQQHAAFAAGPPPAGGLARGDLVFFPGHVGLMVDDRLLVHANAFHMMVSVDPLEDVVGRVLEEHGRGITGIARLSAGVGPSRGHDIPTRRDHVLGRETGRR